MIDSTANRINQAALRISQLPPRDARVERKQAERYVRNSIALDPDTTRGKGRPARKTLFTCHHPKSRRWLSSCTWIEGCRECRATRFSRKYHADKGWEWSAHWSPAYRYQIVSDGRLLTYDEQDNLVFSAVIEGEQ